MFRFEIPKKQKVTMEQFCSISGCHMRRGNLGDAKNQCVDVQGEPLFQHQPVKVILALQWTGARARGVFQPLTWWLSPKPG